MHVCLADKSVPAENFLDTSKCSITDILHIVLFDKPAASLLNTQIKQNRGSRDKTL